MKRNRIYGLTALLVLALLVGTLLADALKNRNQPQTAPGAWQTDIAAAEDAYIRSGQVGDLLQLLKALALQALSADGQASNGKLKKYGTALLDLARSGLVDLEKIESADEMSVLLKVIRASGAR